MVAAMQKNNRMASRLVSKGADVFLLDKNGRTAMDHVKKGHNQVSVLDWFFLLFFVVK
jgi:Ankyrin repeats (many copies)